jgi:integrase
MGVKITKRAVDAAEPRGTRYTIFDTAIPGFGLRVFPSGEKSWIFEYRPGEGGRSTPKRRMTLGRVTDFTPDQARRVADGLRSAVKTGKDPQRERSTQREALTVEQLATRFLVGHVDSKRRATTKAHYEDVLKRLVLPTLGKRKAKDVTRAEVARVHLGNAATPFQANRILAIVGSMYSYGGRHGLVPESVNPARGVERYREEPRERLLSATELERLGAAIRQAETTGVPWAIDQAKKTKHVPKRRRETLIGEHAAAALRLLIFTGARLREILHLKWEHVDLERGLLLLPESKTGKKTIVLNAPALAVLSGLTHGGIYVIAGDSAGMATERPRADLKRPWKVVSRNAGLEGVRLHDLRHNFAAFGAGGGMGLPIIGKLLGHTQPQTTARYAHLDADPLRKASNTIGATIAAAMGEGTEPPGAVAKMQRS